jgi:hypothetical protein
VKEKNHQKGAAAQAVKAVDVVARDPRLRRYSQRSGSWWSSAVCSALHAGEPLITIQMRMFESRRSETENCLDSRVEHTDSSYYRLGNAESEPARARVFLSLERRMKKEMLHFQLEPEQPLSLHR